MYLQQQFRDAINERLKQLNVSHACLAKDLGISQSHLSRFLSGTNEASTTLLDKILPRLGMSVSVLEVSNEQVAPFKKAPRGRPRKVTYYG